MKVLIACEFSGHVRDAFIRAGHDATSCDLLPSDAPGPHHQGDVLEILGQGWDMMVAHPPCTYLSASGMHWTTRGVRPKQLTEEALAFVRALLDAPIPKIALENPVGAISSRIRRPDQIIQPWQFGHDASKATCLWLKGLPELRPNTIIPPAGFQVVKFAAMMPTCECCDEEAYCPEHECHFADCDCLGPTEDAHYVERAGVLFGVREGNPIPKKMLWANQTPSGQNKLGPSADRWAKRSATYPGLAEAMGQQWGSGETLFIHAAPARAAKNLSLFDNDNNP